MTATHLETLIAAADLTDLTDRLMLADELEAAGRLREAEILREGDGPRHLTFVDGDNEIGVLTPTSVSAVQDQTEEGRPFGYVHGADGGFFFVWHDTLEETLASIEEDEADGDGGLDEEVVVAFLRGFLPTTSRGRVWEN